VQHGSIVYAKEYTCLCQCLNDVPDRGDPAATRCDNADFSRHVIFGNPDLDLGVAPLRHLDDKWIGLAIAVLYSGRDCSIIKDATSVFEVSQQCPKTEFVNGLSSAIWLAPQKYLPIGLDDGNIR
jgi:hypothetical protein